jgi:hypothetical protein
VLVEFTVHAGDEILRDVIVDDQGNVDLQATAAARNTIRDARISQAKLTGRIERGCFALRGAAEALGNTRRKDNEENRCRAR